MRREGRQHGMVRSSPILPSPWNPKPNSKVFNQFHSPPTAGLFTRVTSKPTNHSKFTGKCARVRCMGCHIVPACKSKDKGKGTQKIRSSDVVMNHKLLAWRVVDQGGKPLNYAGVSASAVLGHLANEYHDDDDDEEEDDVVEEYGGYHDDYDLGDGSTGVDWDSLFGEDCGVDVYQEVGIEIKDVDHDDDVDDDDDDGMSFCDVGFVIEQIDGDEDWCMVAEM